MVEEHHLSPYRHSGSFRTVCCGEYFDLEGRSNRRWRKLHNEELHHFYSSRNSGSNQGGWNGRCTEHVWKRWEIHAQIIWKTWETGVDR